MTETKLAYRTHWPHVFELRTQVSSLLGKTCSKWLTSVSIPAISLSLSKYLNHKTYASRE